MQLLTRPFIAMALALGALAFAAPSATAAAPDPNCPQSNPNCNYNDFEEDFAPQPVPYPNKHWGLNEDIVDFSHSQSPASYADYVSKIGGNTVKTNLEWWRAYYQDEENNGAITRVPRRWQVWTEAYNAMIARDIRPLFILSSAPSWARDPAMQQACVDQFGEPACRGLRFPPNPDGSYDHEWAQFVHDIATEFPQAMIQVWNEPNLNIWWRPFPDPERYTELVKVAYDEVQAVETELEAQTPDPADNIEIPVVAPGLTNVLVPEQQPASCTDQCTRMSMTQFLDRAYAVGLKDSIDELAMNVFPHALTFGANTKFAESFQDIREAQDQAGDDSKIFVTETAIPGGFDFFPEAERAIGVFRLYNRLMTMPDVSGVVFHRIIEPRDSNFDKFEWAYAWLNYVPPTDPENPQTQAPGLPVPKPVYCLFVELSHNVYKPCIVAKVTKGPKVVRKAVARFEFGGAISLNATYQCSLDTKPFKACKSPATVKRFKPGKHVFRVRAKDPNGNTGPIAKRPFRYKPRR